MSNHTDNSNPESGDHFPLQEEVLRYFTHSASIPLLALSESGDVKYFNNYIAEILDVKPVTLRNFNLVNAVNARDRSVLQAHIRQVIVDKQPSRCEVELVNPNSVRQWIRLISHPGKTEGNLSLCWSSMENITHVRRLEKTEALYQRSAEIIAHAETLKDFSKQIFDLLRILFGINNGYVAISDPRSGNIQFPYFSDQHDAWPESRKPSNGLTECVITTGRMIWLADSKSGSSMASSGYQIHGTVPADWIGVPLASKGKVIGMAAVQTYDSGQIFSSKDISLMLGVAHLFEVFLNRMELEESHHQLSSAIAQAAETIMITDTRGIIVYVNPAFEKSTGFSPDQVIGKSPVLIQSGKHDKAYYRELWSVLNAGETWRGHFVNRKKDGTYFEEEAVISPVRNKDGEVVNFIAVKRDLTREISLERHYIHTQRTEVVGRLVERIQHDFSNLLMTIRGQGEELKKIIGESTAGQAELERIIAATGQGEELIRDLASFAGESQDVPEILNANVLVQNFEPMAQKLVGEAYEIQLELDPRMEEVRVNRVLAEQVLSNLIMNAADAMPQGGVIGLRTMLSPVRKQDVNYLTDDAPTETHLYAVIDVIDSGTGIPDGKQSELFQPDYSTKTTVKGRGHGLTAALEIMRKYQGYIGIKENMPTGSIFRLYFPAVMKGTPDPVALTKPLPDLPRGGETILLAEDDEGARRVIARMLQDQGYNVLEAENGAMAIRFLLSHPGKVDLLLSDMMMPDFDGRALSEQISGLQPGIKVVFVSGYSRADLDADGIAPVDQSIPMLKKPFRREELVTLVRQVLDAN